MRAIRDLPRISPMLWFNNDAEEAVAFYLGIFKNSRVLSRLRSTPDVPGPDRVLAINFELDGQRLSALNGGPNFQFTEAISLVVNCASQQEIDYYWAALTASGREGVCGWLKDKFGLSWQVVPANIDDLLRTPKAMKAMMGMVKLDIAALEVAAQS